MLRLTLFLFCTFSIYASDLDRARVQLQQLLSAKKATVGLGLCCIEDADTMSIVGDAHFPMQSVYKFHLALYTLHLVDSGKLSLQQLIVVRRNDLKADTWSPLYDSIKHTPTTVSLSELLRYAVSLSDNNACDILFRVVGGPRNVESFIRSRGISDIAIRTTEAQMHRSWDVQFGNWTTPRAAVHLLKAFYTEHIVSETSTKLLLKFMVESENPGNRIIAGLPPNTVVAHKTGTSGHNKHKVLAAMNDIAIVTLPNGKHYALSIFVTQSHESNESTAHLMSEASSIVWKAFVK